jgi:hypothetical protein
MKALLGAVRSHVLAYVCLKDAKFVPQKKLGNHAYAVFHRLKLGRKQSLGTFIFGGKPLFLRHCWYRRCAEPRFKVASDAEQVVAR